MSSGNGWDAIVIGGGFAGITAARELRATGHSVLVLEARDRLGGRTWYKPDALAGRKLEMGGTWIHWVQPYVWAELKRYRLGIVESPVPDTSVWFVGGQRKEGSYDDVWGPLEKAMEAFGHDTRELLERPYEPLRNPQVEVIDRLSVRDRIDELDLAQEERDLLISYYCLCCNAPTAEGGLMTMLRWQALSNHDPGLFFEALAKYKFAEGTASLINAMVKDADPEIRLSAPVAAVKQNGEGVTVETREGEEMTAATAVVTVPLNVLGAIEFSPALSEGKRAAAAEGQASRGVKLWVEVQGRTDKLWIFAPEEAPVTYWQSEFDVPGGQLLVGFGPSGDDFDVEDTQAIKSAVHKVLPDVEVVSHAAHAWRADEFSRGTWPVLRPTQLSRFLRVLQQPHGRVVFAGSETSDGWNGYIDGAIESGLRAAAEAKTILASHQPVAQAAV
jgi:pseudooxynicotine oxidase